MKKFAHGIYVVFKKFYQSLSFLLLFFIFSKVQAIEPMIAVTIYEDVNHKGESIEITQDTPTFDGMNNKLSSFVIGNGYTVRFFEGEDYTGKYYTRDSNASDNKKVSWDNRVKSVKILVDGAEKYRKIPVAAILYDEQNQSGESIEIRHSTPSLNEMNNRMSSFIVSAGFNVRFYEGENYSGKFYTRKSNAGDANTPTWDDRIQSVEILVDGTPNYLKPPVAVTMYDEQNHLGTAVQIHYDTPSFGSFNKKLSSFKLSPGYTVRFFTDENYQGKYFTRKSGTNDELHAVHFDNRVSSVKILKAPVIPDSINLVPPKISGNQFSNESYYEIDLRQTTPSTVNVQTVNPSQITSQQKPLSVNLAKDMYIEDGTFVNKTSMVIETFFVEKDDKFIFIELSEPIPANSSAFLGQEWEQAKLINMTGLGNNTMEFGELYVASSRSNARSVELIDLDDLSKEEAETVIIEPEKPPKVQGRSAGEEDPDALRRFNAIERNSAERVQRYERFWINSPGTFQDIIDHVEKFCPTGVHFSSCRNYPHPAKRYATDNYYGQIVSDVTSRLWIKSSVWGMGSGVGKELLNNSRQRSAHIWMNPRLMAQITEPATAAGAEQGLIHEYYHNIGFNHESGWPSADGIDNFFGDVSVNILREKIGDRYVIPNLVFKYKELGHLTYEFEVFSHASVSGLTLRLLSTKELEAKINQSNSNKFIVQFTKLPETDIYVSLYSENSEQMASTAIDLVHTLVANNVKSFNNNIQTLMNEFHRVYVYLENSYRLNDFYLPTNAANGSTITFTTVADNPSTIHYDGRTYSLEKGQVRVFEQQKGKWELLDQ